MATHSFKTQWKYLLKKWDLTQIDLAKQLNVHESLVSKWVNGHEPFPDWAKQKIQERFKLEEKDLQNLFTPLEQEYNSQIEKDRVPLTNNKNSGGFSGFLPNSDFLSRLLSDYERNLDTFLDPETGAVRENPRDDGSPAFLYSEVTGYAIRDFLLLYKITGQAKYLDKAKKAGSWIIGAARHESGWVHPRYYFEQDEDPSLALYSFAGNHFFAFDNGICLSGLVALYQTTHNWLIYQYAHHLADNLVALTKEDGSLFAVFDAQGQEIQVDQHRWSQQNRSFHTKIAAALVDMSALDPCEAYTETARCICQNAMKFQAGDGRFITDEGGKTHLHPHCYSAEGLLDVGLAINEPIFIESAYRATVWALQQVKDGQIPQEIGPQGSSNDYYRTDALAQVLSLGARFQQLGMLEESLWQTLDSLMKFILSNKNPEQKFFQYGIYENGEEANTLSYWTNMFAFHSLLEYLAAWVCRNSVLVILAGGIGSRCWPISCENMPKPLSKGFLGDRSLLEETALRFLRTGCILPENIIVVVSPSGLDEAKHQLQRLKIPPENLVQEQVARGTFGALRLVNKTLESRSKPVTIISMSDNLIEPTAAVRDVLIRAVLAALWNESDSVVSLGIPGNRQDKRYGHAIYRHTNEIIPQVYDVDTFIEKPKEALNLSEGESFAWEGGCVVTKFSYLQDLLNDIQAPQPGGSENISYQVLENPEVHKAVSLYPPIVRFMDFGVPDDNLRQFFLGSGSDKGNGNVALGPNHSDVVFLSAARNLVISDRLSVEVIGISDHLIIDNSYTNSAVVIPLSKVDILPTLYRMLENPDILHPYIVGGESASKANPHHITFECRGHCDISSSHGLALAAFSTSLKINRSERGLRVVDTSFTHLTDFDVDILVRKKSDARLVQHLIDVTIIAESLAELVNLSPEGKELLHKICLLHDYGGFLDDEHIQAEKEIILLMQRVSGLDWKITDPEVMKKLVLTGSGTSLTPIQQQVLAKFNDSINSALEVLDIPDIRSYKYLDELLFCVCNHERPDLFRTPFTSRFQISHVELVSIISCCLAADAWAKTHSLWKYQLRSFSSSQDKQDIAKTAAFICNKLDRAAMDPAIWIRHLNRLMMNESSSLFQYTCNKLRFVVKEQGVTEQIPLFGSDYVYLAFIACDRENRPLDDDVKRSIDSTLLGTEWFQKALLLWLPYHLSILSRHGIVSKKLVEDLAQEVMNQVRHKQRDLWEREEKARASLLQVLNQ